MRAARASGPHMTAQCALEASARVKPAVAAVRVPVVIGWLHRNVGANTRGRKSRTSDTHRRSACAAGRANEKRAPWPRSGLAPARSFALAPRAVAAGPHAPAPSTRAPWLRGHLQRRDAAFEPYRRSLTYP